MRLAHKALEHGAVRVSDHLHVFHWDVGAYCDDTKYVEVVGREDQRSKKATLRVNPKQVTVHLSGLPCRKCQKCLAVRSTYWSERAIKEIARHERTWFCTFTLNPQWQHRVLMEELAAKNRAGWLDVDFAEADEFRLRCEGGFKLITKYWKRVRKPYKGEEPVRPRYIVVAERHVSGLPHYHALVSEAAGPLTYRRLAGRWLEHGFFHARLVTNPREEVGYCTKYLAKSMLSRVRSSQKYGLDLHGPALAPLWAGLLDGGNPSLSLDGG